MPTVKIKKMKSFEESRQALLVGLKAHAKGKDTEKVIQFNNDDVPEFLRKLDEFEERSRKISLMVK